MNRIILVGDGWGAVAACKSLTKAQFEVCVISNDEDVVALVDNCLCNNLDNLHDETIVFAGYKPIVPLSVLENNTCVNIHYSLLPQYRGMHSTVWAILNDEQELGLTIHEMNQFIDDGPIIHQYRVKNDFESTSTHYMSLFNCYVEEHLGEVMQHYLSGSIVPIAQDKSQASWVGKRNLKDCKIDFMKPLSYQKAFFRALVKPYPLPYIEFRGQEYEVTDVGFQGSKVDTHNGRILNIDNEGVWVKVPGGYLIIKYLTNRMGECADFNALFRIGQFLG